MGKDSPETNNDDDTPSFDSPFCIARSFVPNSIDDMIMVKLNKVAAPSKAPTLSNNMLSAFSMGSINGKVDLYARYQRVISLLN